MKTCLIVGNRTLPGAELAAELRQRIEASDRTFYVVVPLAPVDHAVTWEERESAEATRARLDAFLEYLRGEGVEAEGEVGDRDPIQAVRDVLRGRDVEEIVLSTLPPGVSRWLLMDIPRRMAREIDVPITVVTQDAGVGVRP
jgi:nucleotide-binding universal stress UspA family protein